jgi:hypothetical protein
VDQVEMTRPLFDAIKPHVRSCVRARVCVCVYVCVCEGERERACV